MLCPIAGGEMLKVIIGPKGPVPAENDDARVEQANFVLDRDQKQLVYQFRLWEKKGKTLQSVKVEDVSDTQAVVLLEDAAPQLDEKRIWSGRSQPKKRGDDTIAWLHHEGNSTRVYRFTVTTGDGRQVVLHQAAIYPVLIKPEAKRALGYEVL